MSPTRPRRYAQGTKTSVDASMDEVRRILAKYGATKRSIYEDHGFAAVRCELRGYTVQFAVEVPAKVPTYEREQEERRMWRWLKESLKLRLDEIAGIEEWYGKQAADERFRREFMPNIVLSTGETVGDVLAPHLEQIALGAAPDLRRLLPGPRSES